MGALLPSWGTFLLRAPYGRSCKRWPSVKGSTPDTMLARKYYFKHKPLFAPLLGRVDDRGGINPSELCPFFSLPAALGMTLSPSCWMLLGCPAVSLGSTFPCKPGFAALPYMFCADISRGCLGATFSRAFQTHLIFSRLHLFLKNRKVTKCFPSPPPPPCFL